MRCSDIRFTETTMQGNAWIPSPVLAIYRWTTIHTGVWGVPGSQLARSELGLRVEAARKRAKKTQADVAEARIFGLSKLREIERGIQGDPGDVFTLCRFYELNKAETDELIGLADMAKSEAFWEDSRDAVPGWFELYLACERRCSKLSYWHPELVPGVFQTAEYAAEVVSADGITDPEILAKRVKLRSERQRSMLERSDRVVQVVLGAGAFELEFSSAKVMAEQRELLHGLSKRPGIDIRRCPGAPAPIPASLHGSPFWIFLARGGHRLSTWKR